MVIGHVPLVASLLVTTKFASNVQLSDIATPNDSKAATVVTAAGAPAVLQPVMLLAVNVPVTVGAIASPTVIV